MNIELIVIIAIVAVATIWVVKKYIRGCQTKSCACGCSGGDKSSSCGPCKKP